MSNRVDYQTVDRLTDLLIRQVVLSGWKPDYVAAIGRGGANPGIRVGNYFNVYTELVNLSVHRDHTDLPAYVTEDAAAGVNILVVDDFVFSGETLKYIKKDWDCPAGIIKWHENIRFGVLTFNDANTCKMDVDYYGELYDAVKYNNQRVVFPWSEY